MLATGLNGIVAGAVALIAISGCAAARQSGGEVDAQFSEPAPATPREKTMFSAPAVLIEAAIDEAAKRSGTPRTEVRVVSAESVTWPDGSLGCPAPGMMYTQALVPGYRIVLQAGGQQLAYHAGAQGAARFCPADRAVAPVPSDRI
jgi:hypothetical protein